MSTDNYRIKVSFSVINCICHDQRVLKMAETVSGLNCDVKIIGRVRKDCCSQEMIPFRTKRFKMLINKGFMFYMVFNIRLFFYLFFHRSDILVANDLDTLLPNYLVSRLKRIPLIYDSHEYFTGVPELKSRPVIRSVWLFFERMIFPKLDDVITVSEPIAEIYKNKYNVSPIVIKNYSRSSDHIIPFPRKELGLTPNDHLVIIQGNGINIDKGAEELIEAVNITDNINLLVVGSGDVVPFLKERVKELNLMQRARFISSVSWDLLIRYTKTADIGVSLEKDTNLNYRYSLPNKFFDYISAGIPVIASDLPETGRLIKQFNFGIVISEVTAIEISKAFKKFFEDSLLQSDLRRNSRKASEVLNWEFESKKVTGLYKRIISDLVK